jgi:excisionase family DNA binding protein
VSIDSNEQQPSSPWFTTEEASQYLKVKPRTISLWVRQGKVKAFALSGTLRRVWRFRREDLDAALVAANVLPYAPPSAALKNRRTQ